MKKQFDIKGVKFEIDLPDTIQGWQEKMSEERIVYMLKRACISTIGSYVYSGIKSGGEDKARLSITTAIATGWPFREKRIKGEGNDPCVMAKKKLAKFTPQQLDEARKILLESRS